MANKIHRRHLLNGFTLLEMLMAVAIGSLILLALFKITVSIQTIKQQAMALSSIQERMRFLSYFLREKIHMAGNNVCMTPTSNPGALAIQGYTANTAKKQLDIDAKSDTDVLQLRECTREKDQNRYNTLLFFVAATHYIDPQNQTGYALFYKIGDHRKEELIPGVDDFTLFFGLAEKNHFRYVSLSDVIDWPKVNSVKIDIALSAINHLRWRKMDVIATKRI